MGNSQEMKKKYNKMLNTCTYTCMFMSSRRVQMVRWRVATVTNVLWSAHFRRCNHQGLLAFLSISLFVIFLLFLTRSLSVFFSFYFFFLMNEILLIFFVSSTMSNYTFKIGSRELQTKKEKQIILTSQQIFWFWWFVSIYEKRVF